MLGKKKGQNSFLSCSQLYTAFQRNALLLLYEEGGQNIIRNQ